MVLGDKSLMSVTETILLPVICDSCGKKSYHYVTYPDGNRNCAECADELDKFVKDHWGKK